MGAGTFPGIVRARDRGVSLHLFSGSQTFLISSVYIRFSGDLLIKTSFTLGVFATTPNPGYLLISAES